MKILKINTLLTNGQHLLTKKYVNSLRIFSSNTSAQIFKKIETSFHRVEVVQIVTQSLPKRLVPSDGMRSTSVDFWSTRC